MAITTLDGLIAALPAQPTPFFKTNFSPQATGCFTSLWTAAGCPGAGANSADGTGGAIPTDATAGAFPFANSNLTYLARIVGYATTQGVMFLYDRLWHNS